MAAPKTVLTYPLNGALKDFAIPFEYLARKFVVVTLIGATRKVLTLNADYRFSTRKMITTTVAQGPAQGFDLIEIRRVTSATERLVDFSDGSILRAYDLNTAQVQSLHIAEEARDLTADTIGVNNEGNLDARGRRIVNLADAVNPGDAVTLRQNQQWAGSALNQAQIAAAKAAESAQSATNSQNYSTLSYNTAVASQTSRIASEAARDLALQYQNGAQTYATNSQSSAATAAQWATQTEDVAVSGGLYSSYHYSRKSAGSANASAGSAASAANTVALATAQADRARREADRAAAEADALGNMNDLAENVQSSTTGPGNWKVVFKGIVEAAGKVFGKRFEAKPYDEGLGFVSQKSTEAPFFVKGATLGAESAYRPIIKNRVSVNGGADEALSFGILSETTGAQNAVIHWDGDGVNPTPLLSLARNGSQAIFPGAVTAGATLRSNNGVVAVQASSPAANTHTWHYHSDGSTRGILYMDNACNYHVQLAGREHAVMYAAGNTGFNGHVTAPSAGVSGRMTANDFVAVGNVYTASGNAYLATDGNLYGGAWGGWLSNWVNNNFISLGNFRARSAEYFSANQIGSYCFLQNVSGTNVGQNGLLGGAQLRLSSHNNVSGTAPEGTWRQCGWANNQGVSVWIRVA